jgi:type IV pilus assembly protein PilQ
MLLGAAPPARRISLDVKDADVHNVLRLLADTGKVNIVVPDDVRGRVTIKLRNVPWTEALDVILRSKGLGREKVGSVIQVDTLERILAREKTRIELEKTKVEAAEPVTVIIPLSYTNASDLKPLVQSMLSPRGTVAVDPRTNSLIVTDVAENIDRVRSVTTPR